MATLTKRRSDEVFILSEAPGYHSREAVTLKAGSAYLPGTLVVAEIAADAHTGLYVTASADALLAAQVAELTADTPVVALVCRYTNTAEGDVDAAAIVRSADVKGAELDFGTGINLADARAALAAQNIILRNAI